MKRLAVIPFDLVGVIAEPQAGIILAKLLMARIYTTTFELHTRSNLSQFMEEWRLQGMGNYSVRGLRH